jgi:2-polyprenyl-3-methyl-5-hydroxy-6-metoxy-1,4-benzoquinol methylase/glycosyltransferase involved in cell wall biosynthesis
MNDAARLFDQVLKKGKKLAAERFSRLRRGAANNTPAIDKYSLEASYFVDLFDFTKEDIRTSLSHLDGFRDENIEIKKVAWFIPEFEYAYFGGIHTIFRLAAFLKEKKGVKNYFLIIGQRNINKEIMDKAMAAAFPALDDQPIHVFDYIHEAETLGEFDATICTLWLTAYHSLKFNKTRRKFYFIQDFEPLFYPAGTLNAQAEATYSFGFLGIANTVSLKQIYEQDYGGTAEFFTPCVDTSIFYPDGAKDPNKEPFTVFFYGRPGHPRNGFELGLAALKRLKARMGPRVRIVTAGAGWDPGELGLEGIVENLGRLNYDKTAELYRHCDAGFVLMFTRHPSYIPFELMASGCLVVTNNNPANTWLLKDRVNCILSPPSASSLCEALEEGLVNTAQRLTLVRNAKMTIDHYTDWNREFEKIFAFMCRPSQGKELHKPDDYSVDTKSPLEIMEKPILKNDYPVDTKPTMDAGEKPSLKDDYPVDTRSPLDAGEKPILRDVTADGERVTHLYPNDCYFAHLSVYHFILPFVKGKIVLDAGSGSGYGSAYLADHGARFVEGIDVNPKAVAFCKEHFRRSNLRFQLMDLQGISGFPGHHFDVIFSSNVLEHVPDVRMFLTSAWRLLKPDGIMLITVPPITSEAARSADRKNPYHLNSWSPRKWYAVISQYFEDIQLYRHTCTRTDVILDFGNTPEQTIINERDFRFEPVDLTALYQGPTLSATFIVKNPRAGDTLPPPGEPVPDIEGSFTGPGM